MTTSGKDKDLHDFEFSYTDEPHASRRKQIMEKYPQVKELFGVDENLKYKVLAVVGIQIAGAYLASITPSWGLWFLLTYTLGGTFNHTLTLAMHELSHNLAFKGSMNANRLLGFVANLPLGIPSFISFKRYHQDHHKYQGEIGVDADIPSRWEVSVVGNSTIRKLLWVFLQPLAYSLRPVLTIPKTPTIWEFLNVAVVLAWDAAVFLALGPKAVLYMVCGTLLGMGLHPMAGHFIAEHYTFTKSQETYSYYGPLNLLSFNVGYHNEHHDFPNIPGCRLPALKALAPEFYNMRSHSSWVKVIWMYITDKEVGPYSRVQRSRLTPAEKLEAVSRINT